MKLNVMRALSFAALAFLGVTAILGAVPMLMHPSGSQSLIPMSLLEHSPFHSYMIPGLVLLGCNGLLSFAVLVVAVQHRKNYGWWIVGQGVVLVGWLLAEIAFLQLVVWFHYLYAGLAVLLLYCGFALRNDKTNSRAEARADKARSTSA